MGVLHPKPLIEVSGLVSWLLDRPLHIADQANGRLERVLRGLACKATSKPLRGLGGHQATREWRVEVCKQAASICSVPDAGMLVLEMLK